MSRKHKAKPVEPSQAQPAPEPDVIERHAIEAEIRLLVPRLNAHRVLCPAGTVIAPDVDGWPEARVALHVRHGHADVFQAEPTVTE